MLVIDRQFLRSVAESCRCELCGKHVSTGVDPAHIFARGFGGGSRLDIPINVVGLCRQDHLSQHAGKISRETLLLIVSRREGRSCESITEEIHRLLRMPTTGLATQRTNEYSNGGSAISTVKNQARLAARNLADPRGPSGPVRLNGVREMEVVLDQEFRDLLKPLTPSQKDTLKELLVAYGCDPLISWQVPGGSRILVDGYHRYDICEELGLPMECRDRDFANRDDVKAWIRKHHLGRRNMTPEQEAYEHGLAYLKQKKSHGGNRNKSRENGDSEHSGEEESAENGRESSSPHSEDLKTSEKLAAESGVSHATIERDAEFAKAVDAIAKDAPEAKEQLLSGEIKKNETVFLATLPKKKRFELLAKEKAAPGAINKAMKAIKPSRAKPSSNGQSHPTKDQARKAFGIVVRYFDGIKSFEKNRRLLDAVLKLIDA